MNLLQELEAISERLNDGGLFHGGHIHFIQNRASGDFPVLKAGIYGVLENVPKAIPRNLPALVEADSGYEPSDNFIAAMNEINERLIMPLSGYEVIQIIKAADEYIAAAKSDAAEAH